MLARILGFEDQPPQPIQPTQSIQSYPAPGRCRVISHSAERCVLLFRDCLATHEELTEKEIMLISGIACRTVYQPPTVPFYTPASSYSVSSTPDSSSLVGQELSLLLLHLCQNTTTGRYSIIFNSEVDTSALAGDRFRLEHLMSSNEKELWPEVFDNQALTPIERETILSIRNRELVAMMNLVSEVYASPQYSNPFMRFDCPSGFKPEDIPDENISIYDSCLQGVCIREERASNDLFAAPMASPSNLVMVPQIGSLVSSFQAEGRPRRTAVTQTRCYSLDTLLKALSNVSVAMDPLTGIPFSAEVEQLLRNRYATELKLYSRAA